MSLLREIQSAVVDSKADLPTVLRKCRILAARLGNEGFKNWVQNELDGYDLSKDVPKYRIIHFESLGHFVGPYGREIKNAPIPPTCIPEEFRDEIEKIMLTQGVSELVHLANSHSDELRSPWPADLAVLVGTNIYQNMNLLAAWRPIPQAAIVGILATVRNRILNFVLEIEAEAPDAGEANPAAQSLPDEKISQVFNTYIMGSVGNYASGSSDFTQTSKLQINQGDFESLRKYLLSLKVSEADIDELQVAVKTDDVPATRGKFGREVSKWFGSMITKSAQGIWKVASSVASNLLTKALSAYYGL